MKGVLRATVVSQFCRKPMRDRSRWFVGSSKSKRSGSATQTRARSAIRCQPPLSSPSFRSRSSSGTANSSSATSTRQLSESTCSAVNAPSAAARNVCCSISPETSCPANPTRSPRARVKSPLVGSSAPARQRSSVDLPRPFAATSPMRSFLLTVKERSENSGAPSVTPRPLRVMSVMVEA